MARHIEWEIKVTKLCNLRCAYCYEYEELGDPRRLSLAEWRAIIESARWYHETIARRNPAERSRPGSFGMAARLRCFL
jgi:MoaA/NifB/PqqE/SkfB family radical SAM enzyme